MGPDLAGGADSVALIRRRLALRCAGFLLVAIPLVRVAYGSLPVPMGGSLALPRGILVAAVLLALTHVLMRREGRSTSELGLALSWRAAAHLVCGLGAGLLLLGAGALVLRVTLPFTWKLNPAILPGAILGALVFDLITNGCEELAWRGYAFEGLLRVFGHWPAQAITALVAAYFHVLSGWSWSTALSITTVGSVLFALVFLRWRSVPAATGVHVAWNWGRDLVLTPGSAASIFTPVGMQEWTRTQWNVAQAILIAVSLVACAWLFLSPAARRGRIGPPLLITGDGGATPSRLV
jgi:membrane protease YdiL (CAAX protease family)